MDQMIAMVNQMDMDLLNCERLRRSPIPLSFGRHGLRCLMIFLLGLPFALVPVCGLMTPIYNVAIAFLTLGIDQACIQLEEPFGILPLLPICRRTEANLGVRPTQANMG